MSRFSSTLGALSALITVCVPVYARTAPQTPPASPASPAPASKPADTKTDKSKAKPKPKPPQEDPEVRMGREAHEEMVRSGLKLIKDPALIARVETIGEKIAEVTNATVLPATYGLPNTTPYDYKFFIVDDPDINAFSLPGGYIYINKGLLNYCQSDDELAGVLGHEIIHAAHHHVAKLQQEQSRVNTQMMIGALFTLVARVPAIDALNLLQGFQLIALQKVNGFGQEAEKDADSSGITVAQKAGYNPVGMLTFMERLARDQKLRPDMELGIFRTHPPERERAEAIQKQITKEGLPINRRAVTKILQVQVRQVMAGTLPASEVLLDNKVVYRTPSKERAQAAGDKLDRVLNNDVQLFEVKRRGNQIMVQNQVMWEVTGSDTDLPGSLSPEELAETGYKTLRVALYKQSIESAY